MVPPPKMGCGAVTRRSSVAVPVAEVLSVAVKVTGCTPAVPGAGRPERTPVAESRTRPAGRPAAPNAYGGVPPKAATCSGVFGPRRYVTPSDAGASEVVRMVGGGPVTVSE